MKKEIFSALCAVLLLTSVSQPSMAASKSKPSEAVIVKKAKKRLSKTVKDSDNAIKTISQNSYVIMNKKSNFFDSKNKKTKAIAKKGKGYRIYYVRYGSKKVYYGTKNKKWLSAADTHGTVWYQEDAANMMVLATDKKGQISYQLYSPVNSKKIVLSHNSYVYNDQGELDQGTVVVIKKGKKLTAYQKRQIHGKQFYLTDQGWIKVKNTKKA